jgi:AsmA family protein
MRRLVRIAAWFAGGLLLVLLVAAGALWVVLDSEWLRRELQGRAGDYTGRKTTVARMDFEWGATTSVRLDKVEIANVAWAKTPHMLKVEQVEFDIRLWPLLKGDIVLTRLVLRKPEVEIEVGDREQLNWSVEETPVVTGAVKAIEPESRYGAPVIRQLEVTEGKLAYRDPRRKLELEGSVSTAAGKAAEHSQVELHLKGKLEGQPLSLKFTGGSILTLRDTEQPYPLDLDVTFGATKLVAKGTVHDPLQVDRRQCRSHPGRAEPFPDLPAPRHPGPSDAALSHHRQARARSRRLEVRQVEVARRRKRPHRRGHHRRAQEAGVSDGEAGLAEACI